MKRIKFQNKFFLIVLPINCIFILAIVSGCSSEHSDGQHKLTYQDKRNSGIQPVRTEIGEASWYGPGFHGKKTASGEIFDQKEMTAAHPSLPMGTEVKVTNLDNDEKIKVRINDRGPYAKDRVIDLSRAAAKKLDMENEGTAPVKIETKLPDKKDATD